jgi:Protein of unknown function (DUF3037)
VLDNVTVTRYVTPLREGGSLPALVEADNLGTYVMKFRGAGQGPPAVDLDAVRTALLAFEKACTEGPLAGRPLGERFRWLTAPRSTIVQPGPVHSGLTTDPAAELANLFDTLVRIR